MALVQRRRNQPLDIGWLKGARHAGVAALHAESWALVGWEGSADPVRVEHSHVWQRDAEIGPTVAIHVTL